MTIAAPGRVIVFTAAFLVHFAVVGLVAALEGVLWPRGSGFLALSQTPGWYLNGGLVAPVFWAAFLPHAIERVRGLTWRSLPWKVTLMLAIAINSTFFLLMLSDQVSSFNSHATGVAWETPYLTLLPNALQSTLLDIGLFLFVGVQIRTALGLDAAIDPGKAAKATHDLARISWIAAPAVVAHLLSVAPAFVGRPTLSALPILLIFAMGALAETLLFAIVLRRTRRLQDGCSD